MTPHLEGSLRVVLAEDDDVARATVADLLVSLGFTVTATAGTGRSAVEEVRASPPDAVLLDARMPDGSGIEAAREIAVIAPATAIVLFSGDPSVSLTPDEVLSTSAVAFLPKPTPPALLDATLRLAITRARELTLARDEASTARRQLEERKLVERAKGILMRRTKSNEQEAYAIMRRSSQDNSVSMTEIARRVIDSEPGAR